MATNYPGGIDDNITLPNALPTSSVTSPDLATVQTNQNDAIKAIETKLGIGSTLAITGGGTGATTAAGARSALSAAQSGSNSDITSLSGLSTPLSVAQGGSGAATLTGLIKGNGTGAFTAATAGTDYAGVSTTQSLTATFVQPRVLSTSTTSGTVTPTASSYDMMVVAVTTSMTIGSPGTGTEGQKQVYRIKDTGSASGIVWNAIFRAVGVTMPLSTVGGKNLYVGLSYNVTDSKWDIVAVEQES